MKPEYQVCSFEQAEVLFRLGVLPESLYYFTFFTNNTHQFHLKPKKYATKLFAHVLGKYGDDSVVEIRSAYNVSELALLLNIEEGPINPFVLADQLISKLQNEELRIEDVNERLLSSV